MGRKYSIKDQEGLYFVTFTVVNWIDVFIRDSYREKFLESLDYCQKHKGLEVYAYCIMTSHIHLILRSREDLSGVIRDLKSFTSRVIIETITNNAQESRREWLLWMFKRAGAKNTRNNNYQFWQQHNHPIELTSNKMMNDRLEYIHNNPVEGGFVSDPLSWVWSSANNYAGCGGGLEIKYIE